MESKHYDSLGYEMHQLCPDPLKSILEVWDKYHEIIPKDSRLLKPFFAECGPELWNAIRSAVEIVKK